MQTRDEIRLGVGVLLIVQIITMIAAVALLSRMTPAIDQILLENERSIHAVERMLLVLTEPVPNNLDAIAVRQQRFNGALDDARGNITEPDEAPLIDDITLHGPRALTGDPEALAEVRTKLWQLSDINRDSMHQANRKAQRLGTAGAWSLVFLAVVGFGLSLTVMRRFRQTLIQPIDELGAVLDSCSHGDRHRRYNPRGAALEFRQVATVINQLVEEHFGHVERDWEKVAKLDRLVLLRLLDSVPQPTFVCEPDGDVAAANALALEVLRERGGQQVRSDLVRICKGEPVQGFTAERIGEGGWLCRLDAPTR